MRIQGTLQDFSITKTEKVSTLQYFEGKAKEVFCVGFVFQDEEKAKKIAKGIDTNRGEFPDIFTRSLRKGNEDILAMMIFKGCGMFEEDFRNAREEIWKAISVFIEEIGSVF